MQEFLTRIGELIVKLQAILHQYFSPGFWIVLAVSGPILIYRFIKVKSAVNSDKAFKISMIYGVAVYVLLWALRPESALNLTQDIVSGVIIAIMSIANYFILIAGNLVEEDPEPAPKKAPAKAAKKDSKEKDDAQQSAPKAAAKKGPAKTTKDPEPETDAAEDQDDDEEPEEESAPKSKAAPKKHSAKEVKCKRCGAKLPAGSAFCNKCGKRA